MSEIAVFATQFGRVTGKQTMENSSATKDFYT